MLSIYDNDGTLGSIGRTIDVRFELKGWQGFSPERLLRSTANLRRLIQENVNSYNWNMIANTITLLPNSSVAGWIRFSFVCKVDCGADVALWEANIAAIVQNAGLLDNVTVRADSRNTRCSQQSTQEASGGGTVRNTGNVPNLATNGPVFLLPGQPLATDPKVPQTGTGTLDSIAVALGVSTAAAGVLLALGLIVLVRR